jgi:twitching motility protein PilU
MWRLDNDFTKPEQAQAGEDHQDDEPSFTEITLDVKH